MRSLRFLTACLLFACTTLAHAGFIIRGTRVIYAEAAGEATVHLQRTGGTKPVLLQVWLDDGSPDAQPGAQDLPFLLTPAVARVDPDEAQVIRILRTRDDLPHDRESVFFFNALEVPPAPESTTPENRLHLAMQARMKFFYRPRGLAPRVEDAFEQLRFALIPEPDGRVALHIDNPTPYHITLPEVKIVTPDAAPLAQAQIGGIAPMVPPLDAVSVPLSCDKACAPATLTGAHVRYSVINDQGGVNVKQQVLQRAG